MTADRLLSQLQAAIWVAQAVLFLLCCPPFYCLFVAFKLMPTLQTCLLTTSVGICLAAAIMQQREGQHGKKRCGAVSNQMWQYP